NCKPFEVLNLGKYERQYWQGVTFGETKDKSLTEQALYEYLAFILKLYGAQPVAGMTHLHGKKGKAMIHIGAVDAPVTIAEIDAAVDECAKLNQGELHVLGWEHGGAAAAAMRAREAALLAGAGFGHPLRDGAGADGGSGEREVGSEAGENGEAGTAGEHDASDGGGRRHR
ncbi:MAG TPA: hypothetical protein PLS95_19810, partial [Thermoanaerobaculales bacterium]|nr:hypothetical protein [Thermoanaerobaculales bacterium]